MNLLHFYLAKEFVKPFLFSSFLFAFVIQLGHLFDRLEVFTRNEVPIHIILVYLFSMVPLWLIQALPICTLIAGVIAVGNMSASGEIFCLRSSGISTRTILKPLFLISLFLTALTFILGDFLMPKSTFHARSLYRTYVDKVGVQKMSWEDVIVLLPNKRRISAKHLDLVKNELDIVTVEEFGEHLNLRQTLTSKKAEWNPIKGWIFYDGVIRLFSKEGDEIIEEESFISAQINLREQPKDLVPLQILPEELSTSALKRYIFKISNLGISPLKEEVQYYLKFAFPFTHILVLAIGLPIALRATQTGGGRGKKSFGKMRSLALSLLVGFFYYTLITIGQALGESRKLPAVVSVWIANILFLVLGIYFLRKLD